MIIELAERGFDSAVVPGGPPLSRNGFTLVPAHRIRESTVKGVRDALRRLPPGRRLVLVDAGDAGFNRGVVALRGVHILKNLGRAPLGALDPVAARILAGRGMAADIDLYPLIHGRGIGRQRVLQRYQDVLLLQRRFRFPLTLSSGARSVLDLRSVREMTLLCSLFGMTPPEVRRALSSCGEILTRRRAVEVVE